MGSCVVTHSCSVDGMNYEQLLPRLTDFVWLFEVDSLLFELPTELGTATIKPNAHLNVLNAHLKQNKYTKG